MASSAISLPVSWAAASEFVHSLVEPPLKESPMAKGGRIQIG
jgi:hypothetical protein